MEEKSFREVDVLIAGAGLAGLTLARQLLLAEPEIRILMVDRGAEIPNPKQKVGEATVQVSGYYYSRVLEMEEHLLRALPQVQPPLLLEVAAGGRGLGGPQPVLYPQDLQHRHLPARPQPVRGRGPGEEPRERQLRADPPDRRPGRRPGRGGAAQLPFRGRRPGDRRPRRAGWWTPPGATASSPAGRSSSARARSSTAPRSSGWTACWIPRRSPISTARPSACGRSGGRWGISPPSWRPITIAARGTGSGRSRSTARPAWGWSTTPRSSPARTCPPPTS